MLKSGVCPQCQSRDVIPGVRIMDRRDQAIYDMSLDLTAVIHGHPEALIFKGAHESALRAWICGACGYTEFFADNPQELLAAYQRNRNKE